MMVNHQIKVLQALSSAIAEGGRGVTGTAFPKQPVRALKLYEFEGSPFCRRVREVITLLNLDVEIYPCPKGGLKYRSIVKEIGGKLQFPFLIDENTGDQLYESQDIIHHLFKYYGKTGQTPDKFSNYPKMPYLAFAGTLLNGARGVWINKKIVNRAAPEHKLELWSFEASPYSRVVRSVLSELELPYILHSVAKERWQDMGPAILRLKPGKYEPLKEGKREKLLPVMQGKMQVPYLVDPNTGVKMFESAEIVKYLKKQYGS
ncbi:glutathione S-transferase N-terminal domain-containing protein [Acinetobacter baumannii]|uniref:Glutathione S-transferase n=2 Tax=Acinetobacter baumannii TaxID=470 RepID=A0A7X1SHS0_ACIBA|nr:glutathione S-transferase N-terminal domain-containing protein [Acinetobacter baumannii]EHU1795770.1 glutathione S-transferase N-terminal domain-containing protein [Acinetobacter baumannii]EHU2742776.1 glutathione S-transferase N-terminal domain-containing protein [Acinetobacter baumannii]EHU2745121.1 glutathione S-transferase N-terminal domain-containing protein [Acinetobacter baumannii]EHU2877786.1 glutathione S-transferase N-terminal domain-containing protein [Acinetobacter baumannii]EHU